MLYRQVKFLSLVLFLIFFLFSNYDIPGQEADTPEEQSASDVQQAEEPPNTAEDQQKTEASPEAAEEQNKDEQSFVGRSLSLDIETSRQEELIAWCRVLGLDYSGNRENLQQRLKQYYNITDQTSDKNESEGSRIIIESAHRSKYIKVKIDKDKEESMVTLSGDILLTVKEEELNRTHTVRSDILVFNEGSDEIAASGNIEYIVDTEGRKERFTGDSLIFEINDWTGVIFRGTSERSEKIDEKDVQFFFRGDSIKRAGEDILVLENGVITSHDSDNPDYALKAKKIWITGPGEWSLFNATIYVGHVPVLYIPFYWKSGQELFFNPTIGHKNRVGHYIQTTIYLRGRKDDSDDFTMLGFGDTAGTDYELVREGLYLVKKRHKAKTAEEKDTEEKDTEEQDTKKKDDNSELKYFLDGYTNLGAATGFMGKYPNLFKDGSLDFYASIGVSRSVTDGGETYFNDGVKARTYWNNSYIGDTQLPFRWGSSVDFKFKRWKLGFTWYSDPYYKNDFDDRKENFDWMKLLLGEEGDDEENKTGSTIASLKWEISGSHSFNMKELSPWLQSISFNNIKASLSWSNKVNNDISSSSNPDKAIDPLRNFYYPDKIILPNFQMSIRGSLPSYTVTRNDKNADKDSDASNSPDDNKLTDDSTEQDQNASLPGKPEYIKSFNIPNTKLFQASLNYGLNSTFYMEDKTPSASWNSPSDVELDFEATKINTTHTSTINYGMDFWDGMLVFKSGTKLSGYYQKHESIFGSSLKTTDSTKLTDYKYTKFLWDNSAAWTFKPLIGFPLMRDSSLIYSIDANIFSYKFDDKATVEDPKYESLWIDHKEDLKKHDGTALVSFKTGPFSASSSLKTNIPPLDEKHTVQSKTGLKYDNFSLAFSQDNEYEDESWETEPLVASASVNTTDKKVQFKQTAKYDIENDRITEVDSALNLWDFQTSFTASRTKTYSWDTAAYKWIEKPEDFIPTKLEFSFNKTFDTKYLWRNRIQSKTTLNTSWKINLSKPTDNTFTFQWTQILQIYKFLDLTVSLSAANKSMYIYFPAWREQLGIQGEYNLFEDILKSFNIFNEQDRLDSQFNMEKVSIGLVHHLRNWDLSVEYSGRPKLDSGDKAYKWETDVSVFIKWNPLPMFNQKTTYKDEKWKVESFGDNIDGKK